MAEKDLYLKVLTQSLSHGALRAIGIEDVELAELLPTVLPAKELRADTVWRMMDGRIFHLEFQTQRESTLYRFLSYDARLATQHQAPIRTVVLYHAGVTQAPDHMDLGVIHYQIENVYLTQLDGDAALGMVAQHLAAHAWEPPDRLRLALALCMHTGDRRALFGRRWRCFPKSRLTNAISSRRPSWLGTAVNRRRTRPIGDDSPRLKPGASRFICRASSPMHP